MIDRAAIDRLFNEARSFKHWTGEHVSDDTLRQIYDLAKMAPTSVNSQPMRVTFVRSREAKEKLARCLDGPNVERMMSAPACAIIAHDENFHDMMDRAQLSQRPGSVFAGRDNHDHLLRNSTLGGAWLIMAARSLGVDCLPMSGFSNAKVDEAFFAGTGWKSNFLVCLGHGDHAQLHPRGNRLGFDDACDLI